MKYNELKSCGNCTKSSYLCVWPKGNESLPHKSSFTLTKLKPANLQPTMWFTEQPETPKVKVDSDSNDHDYIVNDEFEEFDTLNDIGQLNFDTPIVSISSTTANNFNTQGFVSNPLTPELLDDLEYFNNIDKSPSDIEYQSLENNLDDIEHIKDEFTNDDDVCEMISVNSNDDVFQIDIKSTDESIIVENAVATINNNKFKKEIREDAMFRMYLTDVGTSVRNKSGINLSSSDGFLFKAFTEGFITTISPQITHVKLQPGSVFIPQGIHNDVLQTLFLGCGAAFVALNNGDKEMALISTEKANEAIQLLAKSISKETLSENCDMLLVFLLLFYLKQKFVYENRELLTLNMITASEIIKLWVLINENKDDKEWLEKLKEEHKKFTLNESSNFFDLITCFSKIVSNMKKTEQTDGPVVESCSMKRKMSSNLDLDASNLNVSLIRKNKRILDLLPFQRTILESFIFNYTTSLFSFDTRFIHLMTSPYDVFDLLGDYLSPPIFDCAVPWMNHPVVGASIPIVELQAKLCWLAHQRPYSAEDIKEISNILHLAKYFTPPILPLEVYQKEPEVVQKKLMESCYGSVILAKGVTLFGMKLLNRDLSVDNDEVQAIVNSSLDYIEKLSLHCQSSTILLWSFTVIGSCVINPKQQEYLKWRMQRFWDVLKVRGFRSSLELQQIAWDGAHWDVLFDESVLKHYTL